MFIVLLLVAARQSRRGDLQEPPRHSPLSQRCSSSKLGAQDCTRPARQQWRVQQQAQVQAQVQAQEQVVPEPEPESE